MSHQLLGESKKSFHDIFLFFKTMGQPKILPFAVYSFNKAFDVCNRKYSTTRKQQATITSN